MNVSPFVMVISSHLLDAAANSALEHALREETGLNVTVKASAFGDEVLEARKQMFWARRRVYDGELLAKVKRGESDDVLCSFEECKVVVLHVGNEEEEFLRTQGLLSDKTVYLTSSVGVTPEYAQSFARDLGEERGTTVHAVRLRVETARDYLNLDWQRAAIDAWGPLLPKPLPLDLLRPFLALDILLQGYLGIHAPEEAFANASQEQKEGLVQRAQQVHGKGVLDSPSEWFKPCYEGANAQEEEGRDYFVDRNYSMWCFTGCSGTEEDLYTETTRYDWLLLDFEKQHPEGDAPVELRSLLGSDVLLEKLDEQRDPNGDSLRDLCQALARCAQAPTRELDIGSKELPVVVLRAHEALKRVQELLGGGT